jgi:GAF domain-containing protein
MQSFEDTTDPITDIGRLLDLSNYDLQSPEVRDKLHEFAHQAAAKFAMPIGLVSIVLDSAQFMAGMYGVEGWMAEAEGMPVEWSFCAQAVRTGHPYIVEDAEVDPLQCDNPVVTVDGVRSYAGAPLISPEGNVLGAFCVVGVEPRHFTDDEIRELVAMAFEVVAELNKHRQEHEAA